MQPSIRPATPADLPLVLEFIRELAAYEKLAHEVVATEAALEASLFGPQPAARVLLAFADDQPVGFAVYFRSFSTFLAKPGLYLEDLYVRPEWRGRGFGKGLLLELAREANRQGYGRVEWAALDWNVSAIAFYRALGAQTLDEWTTFRLSGEALLACGK
jgi:GNAT superfamily N-acetyltransferase